MADNFWGEDTSSNKAANSFWGEETPDTKPETPEPQKAKSFWGEEDVPTGNSEEEGGFISGVGDFLGDAATETYRQIGGGIRDAAQNTYDTAAKVTNYVTEPLGLGKANLELPEVERPEGIVGNVVREGVRSAAGMVPANKALKLAGVANTGLRGAGASAASAFTVYGDDDETGSDALKEFGYDNALSRLFETNEDDTFWERKAKHAGEDLMLSAGMETVPYVLRGFRTTQDGINSSLINEEQVKRINEESNNISKEAQTASDAITKNQEPIEIKVDESEILGRYKQLHPKSMGNYFVSNTMNDKLVYEQAQEVVTGVRTDARDLYDVGTGKKKGRNFEGSVSLLPGYNQRMLANVASKVHDTLENGPLKALGSAFEVRDKNGNLIKEAAQTANLESTGNKGLEQIAAPFYKAGQLDNFLNFAAAIRAKALIKRGIETPFTEEQVNTIIGEFKNKKEFVKGIRELRKYTNDLMEYRKASEIYSAEEVASMKKQNPVYIPFNRQTIDAEGNAKVPRSKAGKRKIKGGNAPLANLYGNLVRYTFDTIQSADTNRAKLSFVRMLERGDTEGSITMDNVLREVPQYEQAKQAKEGLKKAAQEKSAADVLKSIKDTLKEQGVEISDDASDAFESASKMVNQPMHEVNGKYYDVVYDNGQARVFEVVDPWLRDQLKSQTPFELNKWLDKANSGWNQFKNIFSTAITHTMDFMAIASVRDAVTSHVNSVTGQKAWQYPSNFINTFRSQDEYRKAVVSGMGISSRAANANVDDAYIILEQMGKAEAKSAKASEMFGRRIRPGKHQNELIKSLQTMNREFFGRGWRGFHEFTLKTENAMRLGEFIGAKKAGLDDQASAFLAQEIATNYSMKGTNRTLRGLQNKTPFLRAGMSGFYRMSRKAKENPRRVAAAVGGLAAGDLALHELNSEFPEYYSQDQRTRDTYYQFPNFEDYGEVSEWITSGFDPQKRPRLNKDSPFYALPKPYDYGQIGTLAIGISESIKNKSGYQAVDAFKRAMGNVIPFTGDAAPLGVKQGLELYANEGWHGNEIVPSYLRDGREPLQQYRAGTDELAKGIAGGIYTTTGQQVSPLQVEYFYNSVLPGLFSIPIEITNEHLRDEEGMGPAPKSNPGEAEAATDTDWTDEDDAAAVAFAKKVGESVYDAVNIYFSQGSERFFADSPPKSNAYVSQLYELRDKAKKVEGSDNAVSEVWKLVGGQEDELKSRMSDEKRQARRISMSILRGPVDTLSQLQNQQDIIRADPSLSGEEKREQINAIEESKTKIAHNVLNSLKNMPELDVMWDSFIPGMNSKTEDTPEWLNFKNTPKSND